MARLIEAEMGDPFSNLALEEALLGASTEPTLRIWENQKSVVIGRAQLAEFETDLRYCRENLVPVVRRLTAGGAVYNGPGNLNWSFFIPTHGRNQTSPKEVFKTFALFVVGALKRLGVDCQYSGPNSITSEGYKISGMAAYIASDRVLCHGTLLLDADLVEVNALTKPRGDSIPHRYPRSNFVEVSNANVSRSDFVREMAGFEPGFGRGSISQPENDLMKRLLPKYRSAEWNLGDPFELGYL